MAQKQAMWIHGTAVQPEYEGYHISKQRAGWGAIFKLIQLYKLQVEGDDGDTDEDGDTVMEIPMTLGVVGALIAPQLAAIGAIAALVTEATVVVEKAEE